MNDTTLVVLDQDDPATTFDTALHAIDPAATEIHLVLVIPTRDYAATRRAIGDVNTSHQYPIEEARAQARRIAKRVARDALGPAADGIQALGAIGRERDKVATLFRKHEYEQIYVPTQDRSLLQRFLGTGDRAGRLARVLPDDVHITSVDNVVRPPGEASQSAGGFDASPDAGTRSP